MEESVTGLGLLASPATPPRAVALRLSHPHPPRNDALLRLHLAVLVDHCGRWRNRTPDNGFGDRSYTI